MRFNVTRWTPFMADGKFIFLLISVSLSRFLWILTENYFKWKYRDAWEIVTVVTKHCLFDCWVWCYRYCDDCRCCDCYCCCCWCRNTIDFVQPPGNSFQIFCTFFFENWLKFMVFYAHSAFIFFDFYFFYYCRIHNAFKLSPVKLALLQ